MQRDDKSVKECNCNWCILKENKRKVKERKEGKNTARHQKIDVQHKRCSQNNDVDNTRLFCTKCRTQIIPIITQNTVTLQNPVQALL